MLPVKFAPRPYRSADGVLRDDALTSRDVKGGRWRPGGLSRVSGLYETCAERCPAIIGQGAVSHLLEQTCELAA